MARSVTSTSWGARLHFLGYGVSSLVRSSALWNITRHFLAETPHVGETNSHPQRKKFDIISLPLKSWLTVPTSDTIWEFGIGRWCQQNGNSTVATLNAAFVGGSQLLSLCITTISVANMSLMSLVRDSGRSGRKDTGAYILIGPLYHVLLWWCHLSESIHIENKCSHLETCLRVDFFFWFS